MSCHPMAPLTAVDEKPIVNSTSPLCFSTGDPSMNMTLDGGGGGNGGVGGTGNDGGGGGGASRRHEKGLIVVTASAKSKKRAHGVKRQATGAPSLGGVAGVEDAFGLTGVTDEDEEEDGVFDRDEDEEEDGQSGKSKEADSIGNAVAQVLNGE